MSHWSRPLLRELAEETGLHVDAADMIGPIWRRDAVFDFNGAAIDSEEFFFVHRTRRFEPSTAGRTDLENRYIHGHRWCDAADIAELAAAGETVYPLQLAELLTEAVALAGSPSGPASAVHPPGALAANGEPPQHAVRDATTHWDCIE